MCSNFPSARESLSCGGFDFRHSSVRKQPLPVPPAGERKFLSGDLLRFGAVLPGRDGFEVVEPGGHHRRHPRSLRQVQRPDEAPRLRTCPRGRHPACRPQSTVPWRSDRHQTCPPVSRWRSRHVAGRESHVRPRRRPLPDPNFFTDHTGTERNLFRARWWEAPADDTSCRDLVFPASDEIAAVPMSHAARNLFSYQYSRRAILLGLSMNIVSYNRTTYDATRRNHAQTC